MIVYLVAFMMSILSYCIITDNRAELVAKIVISTRERLSVSKQSIGIIVAMLPIMFLASVRYYVGTDYLRTYYTGFYRIMDGSKVDGFETGFYYLVKLIQCFTDNAFWLFGITAIIFVTMVFKAIDNISTNIPLSVLMFLFTRYFFIGMNGIRQFIGLSILTYSIKFICDKKLIKFLECVFFACLFHYTCILFVPIYFLANIKLNKNYILLLVVTELLFLYIGIPIVVKLLAGTKYGLLIEKYGLPGIKFTIFTVLLNIIIFLVGYSDYEGRKQDRKYRVFLNLQFVAVLVTFTFRSIPLMERVYWMYSFPIIVTLPYLLESIKVKSKRRMITYGIVVVFGIYMVYDICILGDHEVLPYQWIFGQTAVHYSGWEWYGGFVR